MQLDCGTPVAILAAGDAVFSDHDQFAGQNVAHELGAQQVEGAGFAGEDDGVGTVGIFDAAHGERAEAARIAGGEDAVARHHDDGEGAFDLRERVGDGIDQRAGVGVGDELDDDFGVGCGLEVSAVALEPRAQIAEVDQVAVVRDGDEALGGVDADGLGVEQRRVAGGGVAGVADGHVAGKLGEHIVGEDFRDQAHALDVGEMLAVGGGDAGRFLAAMLQGVEAEIGFARGVGMAVDGDDAAFFAQFVGRTRTRRGGSCDQWSVRSRLAIQRSIRMTLNCRRFALRTPWIEQPRHAETSSWRLASRAEAQSRAQISQSGAEMKSLAIDGDFEAAAAGGADARGEEVVLGRPVSRSPEDCLGSAVTISVEAGSAKRPKSGWASSDGSCSTVAPMSVGKCGLRQRNGDAAVGDIARRVNQLAPGKLGEQACAGRPRLQDRARADGPRDRRERLWRTQRSRRR